MARRVSHLFWARTCSLLVRITYALLILIALIRGANNTVLFNSAIFLITLVTWFLPDERVLWYDALLVGLFVASLGLGYLGFTMPSSVFGWDKLFHFLAGFAVAGILFCAFPQKANAQWNSTAILALALVIFAGWEVYEWLALELFGAHGTITIIDTLTDVVADVLGSFVALWIARR